ncbi:MAG: hypothetical protein Nkreftii_000934 [Candidatus Nitrospira kreftii]|uniref:Uncharacterized protein n=1 Tax=Candidatus Nitrospira kreftii TaxID=2652173 RepID=A0A7S8FC83_9BACT|nr:MAG: hypothetical protein Nkreftii_000934 [Candidatus Nitrospira kreftii]
MYGRTDLASSCSALLFIALHHALVEQNACVIRKNNPGPVTIWVWLRLDIFLMVHCDPMTARFSVYGGLA